MPLPALLNPSAILLWLHVGKQVYKIIQAMTSTTPKWKDFKRVNYIYEPETKQITIKPKEENHEKT